MNGAAQELPVRNCYDSGPVKNRFICDRGLIVKEDGLNEQKEFVQNFRHIRKALPLKQIHQTTKSRSNFLM